MGEPGEFILYKSYKTNLETENSRKMNILKDLSLHNLNVGYSQLEFNGAIKGEPRDGKNVYFFYSMK